MAESNPDAHLSAHYASLTDLRSDFRNYNLFALVAAHVHGQRVLDIGCGLGWLPRMLQERGVSAAGLEPSERMRTLAARVNPQVPIVAGAAEEVDALIEEPIDSVLMVDVLEHIEDDEAQAARVSRVLVPGGQFIVVVPAYQWLYGQRDVAMGHYRRYSPRQLRALLERHGFTVHSVRHWNMLGVLPYLWYEKVLKKPLEVKLRGGGKSGLGKAIHALLFWWMRVIENNLSFGFGLSIMAIATKR